VCHCNNREYLLARRYKYAESGSIGAGAGDMQIIFRIAGKDIDNLETTGIDFVFGVLPNCYRAS